MVRYCRKSLAKSGGFGKNTKRGDDHTGGLSIEGGGSNLLHTMEGLSKYFRNFSPYDNS